MPQIDASASNALLMYQSVEAETELVLVTYGSLERANIYFNNRLRNTPWEDAELDRRRHALAEATRIIDGMNYAGAKASVDQFHQFPRGTDTEVPEAIQEACYEIALKLLDGYDPDLEVNNLSFHAQYFSTVRSTYDRTFALEHVREGVPSAKAWRLIRPFLREPGKINLRRV